MVLCITSSSFRLSVSRSPILLFLSCADMCLIWCFLGLHHAVGESIWRQLVFSGIDNCGFPWALYLFIYFWLKLAYMLPYVKTLSINCTVNSSFSSLLNWKNTCPPWPMALKTPVCRVLIRERRWAWDKEHKPKFKWPNNQQWERYKCTGGQRERGGDKWDDERDTERDNINV